MKKIIKLFSAIIFSLVLNSCSNESNLFPHESFSNDIKKENIVSKSEEETLRKLVNKTWNENPFIELDESYNELNSLKSLNSYNLDQKKEYLIDNIIDNLSLIDPRSYNNSKEYSIALNNIIYSYKDRLSEDDLRNLYISSIAVSEVVFIKYESSLKNKNSLRAYYHPIGEAEVDALDRAWNNGCLRGIFVGAFTGLISSSGGLFGTVVGAVSSALTAC